MKLQIGHNTHNRQTTEDFIHRVESMFPNVYDFSKTSYTSAREPITLICKTHGEFTLNYACNIFDKRSKTSCKGCAKDLNISKNLQKFKSNLEKKHKNKFKFNPEDFVDSQTEITFTCSEHEKNFITKPSTLLHSKHGCPICENESYDEYYTGTKLKTWGEAKKFLRVFFETNNYFPPYTHLLGQNKAYNTCVKSSSIYAEMCEQITPDYLIFMKGLYDLEGNRVGSMYELIMSNINILHKIPCQSQVRFDKTKRTCDYEFFSPVVESSIMLEIAGRHGMHNYSEKLKNKILEYQSLGKIYYEINPCCDNSRWNYEDFYQDHILPFYRKYFPNVKLSDNVLQYLKGSNILESINSEISKIKIENLYDRYIRDNNQSLHNKIISIFKNYSNFKNYFNIDTTLTNGNNSPGTWGNVLEIASLINEFIINNGYFPKTKDIPFHHCSYHGYGIDDFREGGQYFHLIDWDGRYDYNKLPEGFKFPNGYWTLFRAIEFGVLNIKNNEYPRGFRGLKYGQSANTVILENGGMYDLRPGGVHWSLVCEALIKHGYDPTEIIFNFKKPNCYWQIKENVKQELERIACLTKKNVVDLNSQDLKINTGLGKQILNFSNYKEFINWALL